MLIVDEQAAEQLVTMADALAAVEAAFVACERGDGATFPVVLGHGSLDDRRFGVKSGVVRSDALTGLKVGSYWPGNQRLGLANHASTTLLLDDETGLPRALIASSYLTALRTAAADGLAVRHLARPDATSLAIIGAGHQAWFELLAVQEVRRLSNVRVWSRNKEIAERMAARARSELGLDASSCGIEEAVTCADIVVTVTAAREALIRKDWVRPGTHISAMGADAPGKHELDPALVASARLFADVIEQSVTIGEFEAAVQNGQVSLDHIATLGSVITGAARGRAGRDDITIFDSSGMALQDLTIGALALARAVDASLAQRIDLQRR